jgi:hypothetical protein
MRPDDILEYLKRRPFQPFRVTLTGGETFDVSHPEMAIAGRSVVAVGVRPTSGNPLMADVVATLALIHITKIEPLQMVSTGNGQPRES